MLEELTSVYSAPTFIRSDNGPEFISQALRDWSEASDTTSTAYMEPGSPWENGLAEAFNSGFRDEFLTTELFDTVSEGEGLASRWCWEYKKSQATLDPPGRTHLEAAQAAPASTPTFIAAGAMKGVAPPPEPTFYAVSA